MHILKNKSIKPVVEQKKKTNGITGNIRHYPPANKEWLDSIYAYNKNTTKLLPSAGNVTIKLIKNYFNSFNLKLEGMIKSPKLRK